MSDILEWDKKLKRISVIVHGVKTMIYINESNSSKPIALFLHGIGGSHYGLTKLAKTMDDYQPILVDLPGHGNSDIPDWYDIYNLRDWLTELCELLGKKYGKLNVVITHSFGCYSVNPEQIQSKVIFICPVIKTSPFYELYAKVGQKLLSLNSFTKIYNSKRFSMLRGEVLLRKRSNSIRQYVAEISSTESATTRDQRRYQAKLSCIKINNVFDKINPYLVIAGSMDGLTTDNTEPNLKSIFKKSIVCMIDGGHLLPIEASDLVSGCIKNSIISTTKPAEEVVIK